MLQTITPVILTYNEAPNIERTLQRLNWASRIVVIDSHSTDETLQILKRYPQVDVFQRVFDTHSNQWNFGLQHVKTEWVLSLDADYCLSNELVAEMATLSAQTAIDSYFIPFKYCVFGRPLRGTLLPPREALFRRQKAAYIDDGHTQLLRVQGLSSTLHAPIYHDDRKPLNHWLWAQDRYALLEVQKLLHTPAHAMSWGDRLRRHKIIAPFAVLMYCLILKQGVLDGWAGFYYAFQRVLVELLLSIHLIATESTQQRSKLHRQPRAGEPKVVF
jgi:glycosyltransferase involved in cell wall biosynthesis